MNADKMMEFLSRTVLSLSLSLFAGENKADMQRRCSPSLDFFFVCLFSNYFYHLHLKLDVITSKI